MLMIKTIIGITLLAFALYTDSKKGKISNELTASFSVLGLVINTAMYGLYGTIHSFMGILLPIILLIGLFSLKMLGAGDIKLFSAIGSLLGYRITLEIILYSFLCGGVIALILMFCRKNLFNRLTCFLSYIKSCFICLSFLPYEDFDSTSKERFPFAYAVALGYGLNIVKNFI